MKSFNAFDCIERFKSLVSWDKIPPRDKVGYMGRYAEGKPNVEYVGPDEWKSRYRQAGASKK